jgi:hypothetical protein
MHTQTLEPAAARPSTHSLATAPWGIKAQDTLHTPRSVSSCRASTSNTTWGAENSSATATRQAQLHNCNSCWPAAQKGQGHALAVRHRSQLSPDNPKWPRCSKPAQNLRPSPKSVPSCCTQSTSGFPLTHKGGPASHANNHTTTCLQPHSVSLPTPPTDTLAAKPCPETMQPCPSTSNKQNSNTAAARSKRYSERCATAAKHTGRAISMPAQTNTP